MVYYFAARDEGSGVEYTIYMGKDKVENEELIKYGWPNDVWFHVDKMSSAHVYLRLPLDNQTWESIPESIIVKCAQLTKANSIEGNKKSNVTIIYTPHANLLKNNSMSVGSVSFKNPNKVKRVHVAVRENSIVNSLLKTRKERQDPDLAGEKLAMEKSALRRQQNEQRLKEKELKLSEQERLNAKKMESYDGMFSASGMVTNKDTGSKVKSYEEIEDDFMWKSKL